MTHHRPGRFRNPPGPPGALQSECRRDLVNYPADVQVQAFLISTVRRSSRSPPFQRSSEVPEGVEGNFFGGQSLILMISMTRLGRWERLPSVSWATVLPRRMAQRSKWMTWVLPLWTLLVVATCTAPRRYGIRTFSSKISGDQSGWTGSSGYVPHPKRGQPQEIRRT